MVINKGLDGIVAGSTAISHANPDTNTLTYRGYPVDQLATACSFEEVAYLIWEGELPDAKQLNDFQAAERERRQISPSLTSTLHSLPLTCHPMDVLRTAISFNGAESPTTCDNSVAAMHDRALDLMAKIPTIIAFDQRRRHGQEPLSPRADMSFAENLLYMCLGARPDLKTVRGFEIALILYAEHGFNASTFAARVVSSTLADLHSAVCAAVGALKGPLHGGANEAVMHMINEIGDPAHAVAWLHNALAQGRLIPGFGHRVYKNGDTRVPLMRAVLDEMSAQREEGRNLLKIYNLLAETMVTNKRLHPNLDFPSGPAFHLMGLHHSAFTPIFAASRISGWTAHIIEQHNDNALIRPLSRYTGSPDRLRPGLRAGTRPAISGDCPPHTGERVRALRMTQHGSAEEIGI